MSFLIDCPTCGPRSVYEFRFGGEARETPAVPLSDDEFMRNQYTRDNIAGVHREWWFHRSGCRQWLRAVRNTITNEVIETSLAGDAS